MLRERIVIAIALAFAALAGSRAAHAQIVDVQSLIGKDVPEGASGKLAASVDWRTGNTRLVHVGGAVIARYRHKDHLVFAVVRGEYGRSAAVGAPLATTMSKTFEHVRYRWQVADWFATESFVQNEADKFRRLRIRALGGLGGRFTLAQCTHYGIHAGVAYMVEYEQLVTDGLVDSGATDLDSRISSYLVGTYAFNDKVKASETVYVQPKLTDPKDIRLLSEAALTSKLTKKIAFTASFTIAYDSRPPPSTARTDTSLQSGIAIDF